MAYDSAHNRIFVACDKVMVVVNADNGKVVASPPIGGDPDGNGYDPGTGMAFASCRDGFVSVIHEDSPDKYTVVGNINTQVRHPHDGAGPDDAPRLHGNRGFQTRGGANSGQSTAASHTDRRIIRDPGNRAVVSLNYNAPWALTSSGRVFFGVAIRYCERGLQLAGVSPLQG